MIESSSAAARAGLAAPLYQVALAGAAARRPRTLLASSALDARLGLAPGTVEALSGVRERAVVAPGETLVELAAGAAEDALRAARCDARALDCIVMASAVPHQPIPTTAVFVKRALGLERSPIPAFDLNATCIGFLAALDAASALIACGRYERVLVVAADVPSRGVSWDDPKIAGIFGDGAGAVVVERAGGERGILAFGLETFTEGAEACVLRAGGTHLDPHGDYAEFLRGTYFEMDGSIAYRVAAKHLPPFLDGLLARAGVTLDEIDCIVPHQASATAMALMERRLRFPPGRMIDIFAEYGNQVSASLPTALACALERGAIRPGGLVLLLGTAAGISIGGAVWRT